MAASRPIEEQENSSSEKSPLPGAAVRTDDIYWIERVERNRIGRRDSSRWGLPAPSTRLAEQSPDNDVPRLVGSTEQKQSLDTPLDFFPSNLPLVSTPRFAFKEFAANTPDFEARPAGMATRTIQTSGRVDETTWQRQTALEISLELGLGRDGYFRILAILEEANSRRVIVELQNRVALGWSIDAFELAQRIRS